MGPRWIEAGQGDRVLVLLHGVSGRCDAWRPLMDGLAAPGRRVLAWDLPGYDGCGEPGAHFEDWSDSLRELLDRASVRVCTLVGHSLGGMIAQHAALQFPERIRALILACTTPSFGAASGAHQQAFLERRLGALERGGDMATLAAALIPSMVGPAQPASLIAAHCDLMASVPAPAYSAAIRALMQFDVRQRLGELRMPALCLAGEFDAVARPVVMQSMSRSLAKGRYGLIAGAGHLAPFESPVAFIEAVESFEASCGA